MLRGSSTTLTMTSHKQMTSRDEQPEKLKELQRAFLVEAKKYDVLPLDPRFAERFDPKLRVGGDPPNEWTYFGNKVSTA